MEISKRIQANCSEWNEEVGYDSYDYEADDSKMIRAVLDIARSKEWDK
jgi:hypothetical protein